MWSSLPGGCWSAKHRADLGPKQAGHVAVHASCGLACVVMLGRAECVVLCVGPLANAVGGGISWVWQLRGLEVPCGCAKHSVTPKVRSVGERACVRVRNGLPAASTTRPERKPAGRTLACLSDRFEKRKVLPATTATAVCGWKCDWARLRQL